MKLIEPTMEYDRQIQSKRQTMRTYANFKKYERMLLTVIAKTSRCYHRKEHSL